MSIKSKVFAAAATLTLVGGVGAASAITAGTASAATPSCGWSCVNIFSHNYGTHHHPGFVLDVLRQGEKVDQPVILFRTSNSDPAEDFTVAYQGQVSDFNAAGLMTNAMALHYGGGCEYWDTHAYPGDVHQVLPERLRVRDRVLALRHEQRPVRRRPEHGRPGHLRLAAAVWRIGQDRVGGGHRQQHRRTASPTRTCR